MSQRDGSVVAPPRTVTVGPAESGQMIALRVGDYLAIDAPCTPDVRWRLRGGMPVLTPVPPRPDGPAFVLQAVQTGRTGVDLMASGTAPAPRPIRLIVCVNS